MLQISDKVTFLVGSAETIEQMIMAPALKPFDDMVIDFLSDVSRVLMKDPRSKAYSDVVTFGFWLRKGSTVKLKERHEKVDNNIHLGRGVAFHIAPSNVPVNFAYSLAAGLLTGNGNIIRVPSREFEQINIIADAINKALEEKPEIKPYISLVRYARDKNINDAFSLIADTRIVWGGDTTIEEIRKSPLPPRSTEITFADRYSLAVIDSDKYFSIKDKEIVASDFYNDTYFVDQNACTSPRMIIWLGSRIVEAKKVFWNHLYKLVLKKYTLQPIQVVNKLTSSCLVTAKETGTTIADHEDNFIIRVQVSNITSSLMNYKDNSGFFFEYDCKDIMELKHVFDDRRCQTIGIIGDIEILQPLLESGIHGVDRIVPIGRMMDFDLIWDGHDLIDKLTRIVVI